MCAHKIWHKTTWIQLFSYFYFFYMTLLDNISYKNNSRRPRPLHGTRQNHHCYERTSSYSSNSIQKIIEANYEPPLLHLLGMNWIFGSRKYMPHRTTLQCPGCPLPQPSLLFAAWRSVQYSALSFCSVTAHAHRKAVRSRSVYVTLVCLLLLL